MRTYSIHYINGLPKKCLLYKRDFFFVCLKSGTFILISPLLARSLVVSSGIYFPSAGETLLIYSTYLNIFDAFWSAECKSLCCLPLHIAVTVVVVAVDAANVVGTTSASAAVDATVAADANVKMTINGLGLQSRVNVRALHRIQQFSAERNKLPCRALGSTQHLTREYILEARYAPQSHANQHQPASHLVDISWFIHHY